MKLRLLAGLGLALIVVAVVVGVAGSFTQPDHMNSTIPTGMMQQDAGAAMQESSAMMGDHMTTMSTMMGGSMMDGMMSGSGSAAHLVPMLFWGGVLLLVTWALLTFIVRPIPELAPLTILQRRYASGELSREQYEEHRRVL